MKPLIPRTIEIIIAFKDNKATYITSQDQLQNQRWDIILRNPDLGDLEGTPITELGYKEGKLYRKDKPWWKVW